MLSLLKTFTVVHICKLVFIIIKSSLYTLAQEASLHETVTYALYLFTDMHYSSGSTADKVTDPDKTKLVRAETSFVLALS